jgi:hypothetical protein
LIGNVKREGLVMAHSGSKLNFCKGATNGPSFVLSNVTL